MYFGYILIVTLPTLKHFCRLFHKRRAYTDAKKAATGAETTSHADDAAFALLRTLLRVNNLQRALLRHGLYNQTKM